VCNLPFQQLAFVPVENNDADGNWQDGRLPPSRSPMSPSSLRVMSPGGAIWRTGQLRVEELFEMGRVLVDEVCPLWAHHGGA
ncbi:MAG: hypothetical protein O2856_20040, partial [Planctomycetota bacterium]|nr:hypothetical protein [Planctomycetota bacterium]